MGPLGLRDPLCWVGFAIVRCAEGDCCEEDLAAWESEEENEGLSRGAGDGAIAMAALILD